MHPPLATFEDSALIELSLAGQAECFAALMDRHLAAVRRRIGSLVRSETDADDVLQDVSLKVWRRLSTFRAESSFRTWMTRVAVNEALQAYRREQRTPHLQAFGNLDDLVSPGESPHQSLARVEVTQAVRSAVAELPAKYRQVLILRDLEERSAQETAQSLQSTISAVKTRLFRARLMLLAALQRSRRRALVGTEEPAIGNGGKRVGRETTMLRIEKRSSGQATILQLSGRIQAEHLRELQAQIESCTRRTILNLEEVRLVDRAAVYFLGLCELNGVELLNCPLYIREWILREKMREHR